MPKNIYINFFYLEATSVATKIFFSPDLNLLMAPNLLI